MEQLINNCMKGRAHVVDVTVYWRPGCLFCTALMRRLNRIGLAYERVDIWQDDRAAGVVRRASGGDETVPAVQIGDEFLSNPSASQVLATAQRIDPYLELSPATSANPLMRLLSRWLDERSSR